MSKLSKSTKMRGAIFALLLAFAVNVSAQVQVQGTVVDEHGDPAIGATVQVYGTTQGVLVDFNGNFTLSAPAGGRLQVSFMGYHTQIVPVSANVGVIRLVPDAELLDEVIVIGFGTGRTGASLVANVTRVGGAQLQNRPVANALDALQGQVPGLAVFTQSGEPSAISTIRLHGSGSLNASASPLFVVDGMPVEDFTVRALNPNDFESITILRDASATAIYGARAANGVVFITTRRGAIGERGTIRVSGNAGFSQLSNRNLFEEMMTSEQLINFRLERGTHTQEWADGIRERWTRDGVLNSTRWDKVWLRERAPTNQLDVSFSGGTGRTNYFISTGRVVQEGLATRSRYQRLSFRSNVNSQLNNWLRVGLNASIMHDDLQSNASFGANFLQGGLGFLYEPWFWTVDAEGNRLDVIPGLNFAHPEYSATKQGSPRQNLFLAATGFLEIRPIEGLTLRSQVGFEGMDSRLRQFTLPSFRLVSQATQGTMRIDVMNRSTITSTNTAEYRFTVQDDHNLSFLVGHEYITNRFENFFASAQGFTDDRQMLLGAGPLNRNVGQTTREHAFLSFFGRAEYNFLERYFLDFSLRNDASSRFGIENRNAQFWSVGTMWHLHSEEFIQNVSWLNELTARFSLGTSGNAEFHPGNPWLRDYGHLALIGVGAPYEGGTSWGLSTPGNPFLTWENQMLYTLNFRVGVFDNRVRSTIDLYNRITSSMLVNVPQPLTTGFATVTENIGRLGNRGISFRIDGDVWRANRGQSFFTPYVVFNYNRETILELFGDHKHWMPGNAVIWKVGQPRSHATPMWHGVCVETGNPQWYMRHPDVVNPDGSTTYGLTRLRTDPNYVTSNWNDVALRQNTGRPIHAPINGGWGFSAGHRGFHLQTDFSFSVGGYSVVNDRFFTDNQHHGFNVRYALNDFWRQPGDVAQFGRVGSGFQTQFDSRLVCNRSFMRLKTITIGYVFPRNMLERTTDGFLTDARVFLTGRNLLTWTNFSGQDPEFDLAVMQGMNPNTRQFSIGFDFSF